MKVCLDTNIFISVKNEEDNSPFCEKILDAIDDNRLEAVISTIVIAEVLVGFYQNKEDQEAEKFLSQAMSKYEIIPVNIEIAKKAAEIRGKLKIKLPDALISATTIFSKSEILITNDIPLVKKMEYQILSPTIFVEKFLNSVPIKD